MRQTGIHHVAPVFTIKNADWCYCKTGDLQNVLMNLRFLTLCSSFNFHCDELPVSQHSPGGFSCALQPSLFFLHLWMDAG